MTTDVLTALAGTLFPMISSVSSTPNDSPFNSPDRERPVTGKYTLFFYSGKCHVITFSKINFKLLHCAKLLEEVQKIDL